MSYLPFSKVWRTQKSMNTNLYQQKARREICRKIFLRRHLSLPKISKRHSHQTIRKKRLPRKLQKKKAPKKSCREISTHVPEKTFFPKNVEEQYLPKLDAEYPESPRPPYFDALISQIHGHLLHHTTFTTKHFYTPGTLDNFYTRHL